MARHTLAGVTPPNVLVRVRDDEHARIAWAVASIPGLAPVRMLGRTPPNSWSDLVKAAKTSRPTDIVVDPEPDDLGLVVTAGATDRAGISHASLEGLARSFCIRLEDPAAESVWTVPGPTSRRGTAYHFPPPVGTVRGEPGEVPGDGAFAAAGAFGGRGSIVCVDARPFLEAICMAAGAAVATPDLMGPTPVWDRAAGYIAACESLGLVLAEAVNPWPT